MSLVTLHVAPGVVGFPLANLRFMLLSSGGLSSKISCSQKISRLVIRCLAITSITSLGGDPLLGRYLDVHLMVVYCLMQTRQIVYLIFVKLVTKHSIFLCCPTKCGLECFRPFFSSTTCSHCLLVIKYVWIIIWPKTLPR